MWDTPGGRRPSVALALAMLIALITVAGRPLMATTLEGLIARRGFTADAVALVIEDTITGDRLVSHRASVPGPAASTFKLATAIAALDRLGGEHRFETRVLATATIDPAGRLAGDLVLQGGGDPLLDLDGLMTLALAVREAGVRIVEGRFVLDDTSLPSLPVINPDQPVEAGYNAGIGALSLAFNRVERLPVPGGNFTIPHLAERGPAWSRLPFDGPVSVPVQDTGRYAALVFRDLAASLGIRMPEPERGVVPPGGVVQLGTMRSRTVRNIVQAMLLYSNNQVAEILGLAATGAPSLGASVSDIAADLESALPDVDWRGFALTNHSGLDPAARASPEQLLAMLRLGEERHDIMALLPVAGWSGSLQRRFKTPQAALRIWAKTGSLDFASALVGYVLPSDGRPLRIAILISDEDGRRRRDAVEVPPASMRREIDDFTVRARALRDDLAIFALTPGGR